MKKTLEVLGRTLFVTSLATVAACGGGGGGGAGSTAPPASTLNGVAAVGTPIAGGAIEVLCAAGSALTTTTGSMGAWQVTLSGQTLPCAVEVTGGTINGATNATPYHSIAATAGTTNVTPLTDLMVANIVGTTTPSIWFAGLKSNPAPLTSITPAHVTTALTKLSGALSGLTPLSTTNPITTAFTPAPGDVSDGMLTALSTAMRTTGVTYASLLSNASSPDFIPPVAGFGTALKSAYTGTTSGTSGYAIGGTVTGLTGSLALQDNAGDNLTVSANGTFTFAAKVANSGAYNVTILTQPTGQTCTVNSGAGTVSGHDVANVSVVCATATYSVSGTASGFSGPVVLQDNGGDNLTVAATGTFTFGTRVANGSRYSVTVLTHPASQSCSVANGTGTIAHANVTDVVVTCATNSYTIGGTVTGLNGSLVLQNNGGNNQTISTNGSFTFPATVSYGNTYNVTVLTQPQGQLCAVANGNGTATANVTGVTVNCTTTTTGAPSAGFVSQGGLTWMPVTFNRNWTDANTYCTSSTINGQTGWRLPTQAESYAFSASFGSIGGFRNSLWTSSYMPDIWTATPASAGSHYFADIVVGTGFDALDVNQFGVTCVHAAAPSPTPTPTPSLPPGYVSQGGLTWMPVTFTMPAAFGTTNWADASSYCTRTTINGQTGWRMPTKNELVSLSNSGALNGVNQWLWGPVWSSTPYPTGGHYGVYLDPTRLFNGDVSGYSDNDFNYVSCVR